MIIDTFVTGPLETNTYLVVDNEAKEAAVIDPGGEPGPILARLAELGARLVVIVNTHGHFDHVSGNRALHEATGAPIAVHRADEPMLSEAASAAESFLVAAADSPPPSRRLEDGEELSVGSLRFTVLHTPGHSPGGITLVGEGKAFCGDLVFYGSVGRTDLPGGSERVLRESIISRIASLPDATELCPGHGPLTTVGAERRHNPFFR